MNTLADLPIGAKVSFGRYRVEDEDLQDIIWLKADQNHEGYPKNSVTLVTKDIIDLRAFDGKEEKSIFQDRKLYGNNSYPYSNVNNWLNSNKKDWYCPKHDTDEPPNNNNVLDNTGYDSKPGFLYYFTNKEQSHILETPIITSKKIIPDQIELDVSIEKVFFLSIDEVGLKNDYKISEGNILELFKRYYFRETSLTKQCFNNNKCTSSPHELFHNVYWWLRTPFLEKFSDVFVVTPSGHLFAVPAFFGEIGIRPALNLKLNTEVEYKNNMYHIK